MGLTLKAMKKVSEVKHKRQDLFFKNRMRAHKVVQREQIRAHISKGIEILAPAAANQEKMLAFATNVQKVKQSKAQESKMQVEE